MLFIVRHIDWMSTLLTLSAICREKDGLNVNGSVRFKSHKIPAKGCGLLFSPAFKEVPAFPRNGALGDN
jgi:hypothetical protein